jgi:hypothetical protein
VTRAVAAVALVAYLHGVALDECARLRAATAALAR